MPSPTTPQDWDAVRTAFASSILVDTALSSLAENLDGPLWPNPDKSETPANYIDFDYDEEEFDMWYEKKDDKVYYRVKFKRGLQVAYPNEIVEFTLAV